MNILLKMKKIVQNKGLTKILLFSNDILILSLNIVICIILFNISDKEKTYRGSWRLFKFQFILIILIIFLDIILNIKNLISDYKGHNRYGMIIRFFMFYLIIPCAVLTYQRSQNLNHDDIKDASDIIFYIGFINDGLILTSMILSFIVIDKLNEEKILVNKYGNSSINMSTIPNENILEDSHMSNQIFRELDKKEE